VVIRKSQRGSWKVISLIVVLELCSVQLFVEQELMLLPYTIVIALLLGSLLLVGAQEDSLLCLAIFYIYLSIMEFWGPVVSMEWAALEVLCLACLLFGLYQRPRIRSEKLGGNVGVAFYYGTNCPTAARIASLIGLPARNLAPIMYGKAMVPTGKGYIERREAAALKAWVVLDTGKKPTPMMVLYFNELDGKSIDRLGCTKAMKRIIEEIGFTQALTPGGCMRRLMEWR